MLATMIQGMSNRLRMSAKVKSLGEVVQLSRTGREPVDVAELVTDIGSWRLRLVFVLSGNGGDNVAPRNESADPCPSHSIETSAPGHRFMWAPTEPGNNVL